jgi:hypothetical protein
MAKLTPTLQKQFMDLRELGLSIKRTCEAINIDESLYYKWIKHGQRAKNHPDNKYFKFFQASSSIEAKAIARKLLHIEKAAEKGNASAATWWLEHRHPQEFKQASDVNLNVKPPAKYLNYFMEWMDYKKKGVVVSEKDEEDFEVFVQNQSLKKAPVPADFYRPSLDAREPVETLPQPRKSIVVDDTEEDDTDV